MKEILAASSAVDPDLKFLLDFCSRKIHQHLYPERLYKSRPTVKKRGDIFFPGLSIRTRLPGRFAVPDSWAVTLPIVRQPLWLCQKYQKYFHEFLIRD